MGSAFSKNSGTEGRSSAPDHSRNEKSDTKSFRFTGSSYQDSKADTNARPQHWGMLCEDCNKNAFYHYAGLRHRKPRVPTPCFDGTKVTAATISQWTWNNRKCQDWLFKMLVSKGHDLNTAKEKAAYFKGSGPNLWLNNWYYWDAYFGTVGGAIYAHLLSIKDNKGAVPKNVVIS